jgi:hypothetical protein
MSVAIFTTLRGVVKLSHCTKHYKYNISIASVEYVFIIFILSIEKIKLFGKKYFMAILNTTEKTKNPLKITKFRDKKKESECQSETSVSLKVLSKVP